MMTKSSAQSLAVWLLTEHPALFYAVAKHVNPTLGDFSDILSNVGDAFSGAVSSVGDWLGNSDNIKSLTTLAGTYFAAQAAKSNASAQNAVLQTQIARAQTGQPAAPIAYAYNAQNQPVPVYTGTPSPTLGLGNQILLPSGQPGYAVSPQTLNTLTPSFIQKYGLWLIGGGVALVAALSFF